LRTSLGSVARRIPRTKIANPARIARQLSLVRGGALFSVSVGGGVAVIPRT
jgi:hypothetical protein